MSAASDPHSHADAVADGRASIDDPADGFGGDPEGRPDGHEDRLEMIIEEAIELELERGGEETVAEAKRHIVARIGLVAGGAIVTLLGLALLALPGPGLLVIAIGLGMLATEVPFAARLLERVRERLPQDEDGKLPTNVIVMMVVVGVVATAGSIWWALR